MKHTLLERLGRAPRDESRLRAEQRRVIFPMLAGMGLLAVGTGLLHSLIGLRMVHEDFGALGMGLVTASFYAGSILGAERGAQLIHVVGHIRAFSAFAAVLCCVTLAHSLMVSLWAWVALRAVGGLCLGGLFLAVESWLNMTATRRTRGRVLALYMATTFLCLATGQLFLQAGDLDGPRLFVLCAILFSAALVPVAITRTREPGAIATTRTTLRGLYRVSPLAVAGCFGAGLMTPAFYSLGAVAVQGLGFTTGEVAYVLAITIGGGLAFQWPLGWSSDLVDRRVVLLLCSIVSAVLALLIVLNQPSTSFWQMSALCFGLGGVLFALYPLGVALANDHVGPDDAVDVGRGLLFAFGMGGTVAPLLASVAMKLMGPGGLFAHIAWVASGLSLIAVERLILHRPVPEEERSVYVPVPPTSPAGPELDPRQDAPAVGAEGGEAQR